VSENKPSHDRPKPADYHRLLHHMPVAWAYHLAVLDDEGEPVDYVFLDINETFTSFTGMKGEDVLGKRVTQVIPGIEEADPDLIRVYGRVAITGEPAELEFFFPPLDRWYQVTATCPKEGYFACTFLDVSRQKDAEEAVRQHQENLQERVDRRTAELTRAQELLTVQAREIIEQSTPVLQISDGVLVAPLVGTLDSQRTNQFTRTLLERIAATRAGAALLDITGVPAIDTRTAQHLIDTIEAVRLLGSQAILTGVRPAIAKTLVQLGIDLTGVSTHASLSAGVERALELTGKRITRRREGDQDGQ